MLAKNSRHKYRKNRKNNISNENQDLEKEEAKMRLEMSANIVKIAKVTRILLANYKTPVTDIAEIARRTKLPRFEGRG